MNIEDLTKEQIELALKTYTCPLCDSELHPLGDDNGKRTEVYCQGVEDGYCDFTIKIG